jgi:heme A synthase
MSDRAFLFLFSLVMIVGGLAFSGWLVATGQALTVDGLFLLLTALLVAAVFGLYVMFMINREREAQKAASQPAKAAPAKSKPAPAPAVTES